MHLRGRRLGWHSIALPWKVFIGGAAIVVLVIAIVFAILSRWAQRSGEAVVQRELEQSADLVAQILSGRQRSLAGGASVFVQGPYFRAIVAESRRYDILDQTFEADSQLDADWVFIVDERGILLAKSDETEASGGDLSGVPLVSGALQGRVTGGFGVSRDSLLFQAIAVPIVVPGSAPIGALVATKLVDSLLARDVKAATSADIVFYVRDAGGPRIAATSFGTALGKRLTTEVADQPRSHAVVGGKRYATQGASVTTAGGEIVGGYVVMSARDAASAEIAEVRRALLLAGLAGLAGAALFAVATAKRVARPLRAVTSLAERATRGDYVGMQRDEPPQVESRDEVDAADSAVSALITDLRDRQVLATAVSASLPAVSRLAAAATSAAVATPTLSMHRVQGTGVRLGAAGVRRTDSPRDVPASGELAAGDVVAGRYLIDAVLGGGELGVTYRARDRVAACTVALKRFRSARTGGDAAEFIDVLREEVRVARRIAHRNVVRLHDVGEDAGVPFVTVDYVEGISLAALLRAGGPLSDEAVLAVAKQLCRALVAAEELGVVHGSLSPRQILLGYDGVLKVGDFTLARVERRARGGGRPAEDASRGSTIPQLAGATVGAPEYMAPEQLIGEEPSTRADLYAAGVVLYECVTGATPFRTDSPLAFLAQKLGDAEYSGGADALRASRPTRSSTALVLSEVIARMIAPDAEQRPRSASALLELLERAG